MRTLLLSIFWITSIGNLIQALIIVTATWFVFSELHSFLDLDVALFVGQVAPWLYWVKILLTNLLGDFGIWILSIPILVIAPLKFIIGVFVSWWAYSAVKHLPIE